jgi:Tol biopolymer transport system component
LEFGFPVFSEDGSTLYSVGLQRQGELVRWDVRTRQMVPCLRGLSADGLSYSPDGRQLAYLTWPERALWKSAVDGSEPKRLTGAEHEVLMPRWTPQGDALVMIGRKGPQRPWKLYRMSAREGAVWEPLLPDRENVANPNYSPDGGTLLFGGAAWMTGFAKGTSRLWTWNGGTSQPREVPGSEDLWSGKWSPDGRKILAETLDSLELRLFDVAAGTWKTLYRGEQVIGYPVWSLDSRWVYFNGSATRERGAAVWRVEAATGRLETVLELGALSLAASLGSWFGMDPEGGLLFLRDASRTEVYAMELGFAWR